MSLERQAQTEMAAQQRLMPVDLSALADCTVDPTRYAMAPILPRGHVTLMGSHGGAGKSVLAETFAAHVGNGTPWAGLPTPRGRVVFVSLEDPGDLAKFRLRRICEAYSLAHSEVADHVLILDGSSTDSVLATEVASAGTRTLAFTETMNEIEAAAVGCRLLVIDNASDAFSGNENERQLVRAFLRKLAHIARKNDCAVLLLAHVDKAAARYGANGNSYSGSTAWHNTVRSRLALIEDDQGPSLVQEKLNLGRKLEPIRLEWTDTGVLMPVTTSGTVAVERDTQDDAGVLAAITAAIGDGATVHAARSGNYSTLSVLKTYPDLPRYLSKDSGRFFAALTRLERAGRISRETYRNENRKERVRLLVRCASPPYPLASGAGAGCAAAPANQADHWRATSALAQCQRCEGSGCAWCRGSV